MKPPLPVWISFLLLLAFRSTLVAQAVVEYGMGAGRAAVTTAPAHNLGKQIGGVLGGLDKTLKSGQTQAESPSGSTSASRTSTSKTPQKKADSKVVPTYEDPKGIQAGIGYDELIRRFGPASMELTTAPGSKTLTYSGRDGVTSVGLHDGKAISVDTTRPQQALVVLPH